MACLMMMMTTGKCGNVQLSTKLSHQLYNLVKISENRLGQLFNVMRSSEISAGVS